MTAPAASDLLAPDRLIAEAQSRSGLTNLGDDDFLEPLQIVCGSLATEAPLTPEGRAGSAERLIGSLVQRAEIFSWLDRHPEILDEEITAPLVIAGLPRTGTTMLYRMLAVADGFAAPLHFEAIKPAPDENWDFVHEADPRIPAAEASVAAMFEAMPELASIYPYEAMAPEESIYLYRASLRCTGEQSAAYVPAYDRWFRTADKRPAYRYLHKVLQLLQWQRRRSGRFAEGTRWLLKTPDHLHGLAELLDVFPGVQIIQTHRDPVEAIPSICSFIRVLHAPSTASDDSELIGAAWCAMFADSLARGMQIRDASPSSFHDVWYHDTVTQPRKVADSVFEFCGETLTDAMWKEMAGWREDNRRDARPAHRYTLEQFGLTAEHIEDAFAGYRERFIVGHPVAAE